MKKIREGLVFSFVASLTLGLAPFLPEPHLIGKLRWVFGGAKDMQVGDYFDLVMHGAPWLALFYFLVKWLRYNHKEKAVHNQNAER